MEGTCALCFYRIHGNQDSVQMKVGEKFRPVHRYHESEGKIKIIQTRHNIIDEVVVEEAKFL